MYIGSILIVLASVVFQSICSEKRSGLALLDDGSLNKLDHEARRELLVLIANKVKATAAEEKSLSATCDAKIQASIESCKTCKQNICPPETNIVDTIKTSVSHVFHSVFGKRGYVQKRCTKSCPICDQIDVNTHSKDQVLKSVCGGGAIAKQEQDIAIIKHLSAVYNSTLTHNVVTKVEYDPASIRTEGGVSFATSYVTFTVPGKTSRFQSGHLLNINDITSTGKLIGHEIWARM